MKLRSLPGHCCRQLVQEEENTFLHCSSGFYEQIKGMIISLSGNHSRMQNCVRSIQNKIVSNEFIICKTVFLNGNSTKTTFIKS